MKKFYFLSLFDQTLISSSNTSKNNIFSHKIKNNFDFKIWSELWKRLSVSRTIEHQQWVWKVFFSVWVIPFSTSLLLLMKISWKSTFLLSYIFFVFVDFNNKRWNESDLIVLVLNLIYRFDIQLNNAILAEDKHKSM